MDFKKIISAAMIPTIVLVVLGIVNAVISVVITKYLPLLCFIPMLLSLPIYVINLIILGWAGYSAAKKYQLDLVGAALTGVLAAFVSSIISQIVLLVLQLATGLFDLLQWVLISVLIIIAAVVLGAVLGAIGGFLGQGKKK